MPQMSPINWLSLFFIFSFTFIIFNILNYFSLKINLNNNNNNNNPLLNNKLNNYSNLFMNWKW